MPLPTVTQTWTFSPNNRVTFVSLNDTMKNVLYGLKNFLVATMGYTVKYTCDGTTGPTSGSDHTDRWASAANAGTRGATSTTAQSFAVLTDGNGVDILLAYCGATDDVAKMSISPGGNFTPAGTANQQPTATDEIVNFGTTTGTGGAWIGATASLDRVWHAMATTDKKMFRIATFRSAAIQSMQAVEKCTKNANINANFSWSPAVIGYGATTASTVVGTAGAIGPQATNPNLGYVARIDNIRADSGGAGENPFGSSTPFGIANPDLQAASPIVPISVSCVTNVGVNGLLADRIDAWTAYSNGIAQGDTFGTLNFIWLASYMFPWDGVTSPQVS